MRTIFEASRSDLILCPSFNYRGYKIRSLQPRDNLPAYHGAFQGKLAPFLVVGPKGVFVGFGENVDPWLTFMPDGEAEDGEDFPIYDKNLFNDRKAIISISSPDEFRRQVIRLIDNEIYDREDYIIEMKDDWTRTV